MMVMSENNEALSIDTGFERGHRHSMALVAYDAALLFCTTLALLVVYPSEPHRISIDGLLMQILLCVLVLYGSRLLFGIYNHVWRYGGTTLYIRLVLADTIAGMLYYALEMILLVEKITFIRAVAIISVNLLLTISARLVYQYLYDYNSAYSPIATYLRKRTSFITGLRFSPEQLSDKMPCKARINIAIVGAGRVGAMLSEELRNNPMAYYKPVMFIEKDKEKVGRYINDIRIYSHSEVTKDLLSCLMVQEIVFAVPGMDIEQKKSLYEQYKDMGCRIKTYDYPTAENMDSDRRKMREFDIEELLFRPQISITTTETSDFYRDKVVLITGGGGSIGSELCRQVAKMKPRELIILDIYENGAYDIQQELAMQYGDQLSLTVEIASVCDRRSVEKILGLHHPDIVLHAAAHKHVPLMERNCCEAVKNNVFGTQTMVECCEAIGVAKFIMISTDKAVNPTNIMGATKRMCELIIQNRSGKTNFSAVRFGNVLGSNGSVIPLFKRQIEKGGPITITDKRIIRYFMTIPEASQLVLTAGAMAQNGEIYVLDMGYPVKILDLAENMIRLSGYVPYTDIDIVETGMRPGEKLYEELLINSESLEKTNSELIFVERGQRKTEDQIVSKLRLLEKSVLSDDPENVRAALMKAVPTFHHPDDVNFQEHCAEEMKRTQVRRKSAGKAEANTAS